ncbi:MAG: thioredoxin domain-containing protein [Deltaproteobacteria bacterium]|nr:thioredoxin domain-containing protein [Deltaproteobacteria bacterium]MBN2670155.1 thioredoxin domain-containing protein [Deltaproteobacteria bacterium]
MDVQNELLQRIVWVASVMTFFISGIGCQCNEPAVPMTPHIEVQTPPTVSKNSCDELIEKVCTELGDGSAVCGHLKESKKGISEEKCTSMLVDPEKTLAEFKRMEESRQPLDKNARQRLVDGMPPAFGPADAPVTVVIFSDFNCKRCVLANAFVLHIGAEFGDRVQVVFRSHPLNDAFSEKTAEATMAAHAAGKFWEYAAQLQNNMHNMNEETLLRCAEEVGLNRQKFLKALEAQRFKDAVETDMALAKSVQAGAPPFIFVNGIKMSVTQNVYDVKRVISEELEKAKITDAP